MTREQVETEMAQYRTIFTVVRLLDAAQVGGEESINSFCSCYSYWGKNTPCRNCISRQVLEDHRQRTKLEYMGSEVFQVTAVYREVDGVPCIMELVQKLDGETLIDPENGDRLIDSITSYHTKLYHDALTDSYNRLYFEDALKDKTDPAGVAVLDLDDFKLINDTNGHQAGDMALRTCVDVVRACIRKSDVLIRYGGDEFLLVLPGIERAAFLAKLDRIREQLHTTSVPGYSRLRLSASIGGVITQPGETVEQAVSRADKLMYQAKNRKNMVVTEDNARDGALSAAGRESHSRQSILIVDDSEMNRAILAEILGSDYNILEATNGRECLAMLEQYGTGIALILLDIVMPVMDGFAVLSEMNRNHWIEDIPVIMISSEGRRHRCAPRLRAGRLGLCQPPVRCGRRLPPRFQHDQALRQAAAARLAGDEPDQGKREKHQDDDLDPERGRRVPQRRERPARAAHRHADPAPSGAADAENRQV